MELTGRVATVAERAVLFLTGEVDLATLPTLDQHLQRLVNTHSATTVAVDVDGVSVLADSGLGLLLGAAGHARRLGGDLVLVCSGERLLERFRLTGLDRAVRVESSASGDR